MLRVSGELHNICDLGDFAGFSLSGTFFWSATEQARQRERGAGEPANLGDRRTARARGHGTAGLRLAGGMDVERTARRERQRERQRERDVERAEANDPDLHRVNWWRQNVGDEEVERLARALPGNTVLRVIDLDNNADLTSVDALIECLPRSKVTTVRLDSTGVPAEKVKVVIKVLSETAAR